jgi:hypothetical protein
VSESNTVEMEIALPVPGVAYSSIKLRASRTVEPGGTADGGKYNADLRQTAWDDLADELAEAYARETARVLLKLFPEKAAQAAREAHESTPAQRY